MNQNSRILQIMLASGCAHNLLQTSRRASATFRIDSFLSARRSPKHGDVIKKPVHVFHPVCILVKLAVKRKMEKRGGSCRTILRAGLHNAFPYAAGVLAWMPLSTSTLALWNIHVEYGKQIAYTLKVANKH